MNKQAGVWTVIAILALALACAPSEETTEGETAHVPSETATDVPAAAVMIAHRVADYDAWKSAFDDHMQARKDASCLGHSLKRGIDDPDMIYVYCLATDADQLRAFLDSPDLAEAMKNAGVEGAPTITLMKPISRDLVEKQMLPGIVVMHAVEDYDTWRVAYDEFDAFRRQNGIVGHAVNQEIGNPNNLVIYHQAKDLAQLRAFVDSAELKDTMQRAGVVGEPDIRFIEIIDFADY